MGLAFVAVFLDAGSLSTTAIVNAQSHIWYGVVLLPSFLIYLVTMVGETNRIPFDLPEGEGEIVAGHMTEYSSMKFAMFFLAEYINRTTVSALATTLFLGGWRAPWPLSLIGPGVNSGWWPVLWFLIKVFFLLFCYVWLLLVATVRALKVNGWHSPAVLAVAGIVLVLFILLIVFWDNGYQKHLARVGLVEPVAAVEAEDEWDYDEDGELVQVTRPAVEPRFPVPPLDLPHYHGLELGTVVGGPVRGDATDVTKEVSGAGS